MKNANIALVERQPALHFLGTHLLEQAGYQACSFPIEDLLHEMKHPSCPLSLALVDISYLREEAFYWFFDLVFYASIPLLFWTTDPFLATALRTYGYPVFLKPFKWSEIFPVIEALLHHRKPDDIVAPMPLPSLFQQVSSGSHHSICLGFRQ